MKITIRANWDDRSVKKRLNEVIKVLKELSNDHPDFINPDNVEVVIEYQEVIVVDRHYSD